MDSARPAWQQVRLRVETVARLEQYRDSLQASAEHGLVELPESDAPGGGPVSLDWLVRRLLNQIDEHRERARAQRERRRLRVQAERWREMAKEMRDERDKTQDQTLNELATDALDRALQCEEELEEFQGR